MQNQWKKAENIPLKYAMLVMWATLFMYLFGPIRWIKEWNFAEVATILLLIAYFAAFAYGYYVYGYIRPKRVSTKKEKYSIASSVQWTKILRVTIYINLALTVGNALLYSSVTSVSGLINKAIAGLISPSSVYYGKEATSRAGSLIVWITFFYSPMMYITNVLSIWRFKSLTKVQKVCVVLTLMIEMLRWLSIGTNKGLFDIVLLFVTYYLMIRMQFYGRETEHTKKNRRRILRVMLAVFILAILFFSFFGAAISSRVGGRYNEANYANFPYNLVPEGLRFLLDKVDSYLVQGYDNMEKIIENCEFQWTFGVGNSRFLMDSIEKLTKIDLSSRTYPYQLEAYGIDPLASWHSAYAWFASDLSFVGVIGLMFAAGYFMCALSGEVINQEDPISMALLYLMIMMVTNASCTNYILAYTNGFAGFWVLFVWRILRKKRVKFIIGRWSFKCWK